MLLQRLSNRANARAASHAADSVESPPYFAMSLSRRFFVLLQFFRLPQSGLVADVFDGFNDVAQMLLALKRYRSTVDQKVDFSCAQP